MQKKQTILVVASLLVVVLSVTLAYFTSKLMSTGNNKASLTSSKLEIVFTDTDGNITGDYITPGWSDSKTFTVENKSNGTYKYDIIIKDLVNTFKTYKYLQYKITSTDGGYNMTDYFYLPKSSSAEDVALTYEVSIDKGKTHTYTVEIKYVNDEYVDQSIDMGKSLSGTIYIREFTKPTMKLTDKLMADNPTIGTRTTFTAFTDTNIRTLYKATEQIGSDTAKDVYYFAGDAKNNWVKFAGFYWRIIRTNHDGSIRLLYAGTSLDTIEGYIGNSVFNTTSIDPMYVGYKYGTSGSLESNRTNENDSTIKTYVDNWYKNNLTDYTKFLSNDAVYCNDRNLASGSIYSTTSGFDYASYERIRTKKQPTYNCTDIRDAFSVNNTSAKLDYPIGLMTADEIAYAGGQAGTTLDAPYAWYYTNANGESITGNYWTWSLSPYCWSAYNSNVWRVFGSDNPGGLYGNYVGYSFAVRPSVSLSSCNLVSRGDGSPENPYVVYTGSGVCD